MSSFNSVELRFLLIGGWNTVVGLVIYTVVMSSLMKNHYLLALICSYLIAGTHSYITQRVFVWKSQGNVTSQFFRFGFVLLGQFATNALLLYLAVDVLGLDALISQYVVGFLIVVFTFYAHKHWTFHTE